MTLAVASLELRREPMIIGHVYWTHCSKHMGQTDHLWTGHKLVCLAEGCHPEMRPSDGPETRTD